MQHNRESVEGAALTSRMSVYIGNAIKEGGVINKTLASLQEGGGGVGKRTD